MKRRLGCAVAAAVVFLGFMPALSGAQSLGEIARKLRAEQEAQGKKAVKVYTNDTIPHGAAPSSEPANTTGAATSSAPSGPQSWNPAIGLAERAAKTGSASAPATEAEHPAAPAASKTMTRAYWQQQFKRARARLARAKEEQTLSQNELQLLQIQKYQTLDPNLISSLTQRIAAEKTKLTEKEATTARAQKALDSLKAKFKASGAPASWSQTP